MLLDYIQFLVYFSVHLHGIIGQLSVAVPHIPLRDGNGSSPAAAQRQLPSSQHCLLSILPECGAFCFMSCHCCYTYIMYLSIV